ncbi:MAG: outer membrane lipoprotein-sorting protein, partial [Acidobacteriota bacterium]|nr:outer membrane lipoprotein-sorting protein [Acidobacteriota bacterium]
PDKKNIQKNEKVEKVDKNQKNFTAEQIAESAIYIYGSRPLLAQIRRNGVERGRVCKPTCDLPGKTEEATFERRFVRGDSQDKDKVRLDQKMPTLEYSLIYGSGRLWGIINGAAFTPRQDAANTFLSQHRHSIDTLLRYKENGSTLILVGKEKLKGIDLYVLDVADKDKQTTRYYISVKTLHVLWLEYDEPPGAGFAPVKYSRKFLDYRYAQGTLVPYRNLLLEEGKQTQETRILTVTYGIKLDDSLFKSPEA